MANIMITGKELNEKTKSPNEELIKAITSLVDSGTMVTDIKYKVIRESITINHRRYDQHMWRIVTAPIKFQETRVV